MNDLTVITTNTFNYNGFAIDAMIDDNDQPWFIVKDICNILGHSNATVAVRVLDDTEVTKLNLGGQRGDTLIVNESGLYTLIMMSRKPAAKDFRKWVTSEVLPSIRKTGQYSTKEKVDYEYVEKTFGAMLGIAKLCGLMDNQALLTADNATNNAIGIAPLALTGINLIAPVQVRTYTATELGKELGIKSAQHVNKILAECGLQIKALGGKGYEPTELGQEYGEFIDAAKAHSDGFVKQWKWYRSVLDKIPSSTILNYREL